MWKYSLTLFVYLQRGMLLRLKFISALHTNFKKEAGQASVLMDCDLNIGLHYGNLKVKIHTFAVLAFFTVNIIIAINSSNFTD
jgi:hypothetical protein